MPFALPVPAVPLPANVETFAVERVIARILLFPESATYRIVCAGLSASPNGLLNLALEPTPLSVPVTPVELPASKVFTPVETTIL